MILNDVLRSRRLRPREAWADKAAAGEAELPMPPDLRRRLAGPVQWAERRHAPTKNPGLDEAIRAIPAAWFKPVALVYWLDLLASTAVGWTAMALSATSHGWERPLFFAVAAAALYRAVLFIHEITHRAGRELPLFAFVWNAAVGVPLLIPSFLYEGVHTDHHRQSCYGTDADPEYVPFGRRSPFLAAGFALASILAPAALAVRFGILAPLSWMIPSLRRTVVERYSALTINPRYVRRVPLDRSAHIAEAAACVVCWVYGVLWWHRRVPGAALWCWAAVSAAVSAVNAIRTLAAHRYEEESGELSMTEQLLDSCTIDATGRAGRRLVAGWRAVVAPVGLRYHALHHWIPSLPYHNLGRAHRALVSVLHAGAPYHATIERGFLPPLRDLLRRSRTRARRPC
jgi:fatty acid desaturase